MATLEGAATGTAQHTLRRADGVQLIGEMAGSGYRVPPSLVRRGDGQTIQLTTLLYLTLDAIDGVRSEAEVAAEVSRQYEKTVSVENVRRLVDEQLRPLGLLLRADGSEPEVKRSDPLLGLRFRYAVTDPDLTRRLTAPFALLFKPFVVGPMLVAFLAVCWWVLFEKGLASATYEAFEHPGLLLLVFAVTVLSAGFHEFGHAAAARYGGSTPGVMGAGIYLVWPAFYTDVTDSYRLGRGGRVRTDLGGLYFNAIVAVLITGTWWVAGHDALLLVVATQILQMLRQLLPLVRFDGYHVLADVTGVPDLFHRIKPTLLGLLPWHRGDHEAAALKPWARAVVTVWVLTVVPLLLFTAALMVLALPRILATAGAQLQRRWELLGAAWGDGDLLQAAAQGLTVMAITVPTLGILYILGRAVRQLAVATWRATDGKPAGRALAGVTAALFGALAWAWWPDGDTYRPIQPTERGTVTDVVADLAASTGLARPAPAEGATVATSTLDAGQTRTAQAVWDTTSPMPTEARPQLALVLVPREGIDATADAWVFPFSRPLAPGPGDNQALAVNTEDGTTVYDVAFALVWVEDGQAALNTNEAYAYASCTSCASVAIAFQVVLVLGDNDTAVPQNLAGALNYDCVNCLTYSLAQQLFVTLEEPLSPDAMAALDSLWQEIAAYGADIEDVPLEEVADTLDEFQAEILRIVQPDQAGTSPSPSPSASPESSPEATPTATPTSPEPTAETEPPTPSPTQTEPSPTSTTSTEPSPTPTSSPTG